MKRVKLTDIKNGMEVSWKDPSPIEGQEFKRGVVSDVKDFVDKESIVFVSFDDGGGAEVSPRELYVEDQEPRGVVKDEHYAFAKGYYDGRHVGVDMNPYEYEDDCRYWYRAGYDAGVSDYIKDESLD